MNLSLAERDAAQECYPLSHVLTLSDGQAWNLRATDGARAWLQEFARILTLPIGAQPGIPHITFVRGAVGGNWFGQPAGLPETHQMAQLLPGRWTQRHLTVMRLWSQAGRADRVCELLNTTRHSLEVLMMWQSLHPVYDAVMDCGGMPLHAALVEHEGRGVLLAGSGGTGKTTCCERLPPPWRVWCDDETLVTCGRGSRYSAHPFPTWNDLLLRARERTWNVRDHVPLAAICYLRQSKIDRIDPMGRGEAASRFCQSSEQACFRQLQNLSARELRAWRERVFRNACALSAGTPTFALQVSRFGPFWHHMEEALDSLAA